MTIFNTPILTPILRIGAHIAFRLVRWRAVGEIPSDIRRCVVIALPHTSFWDFAVFLGLAFVMRRTPVVMIKKEVFRGALNPILHYCGAIPIDRSSPKSRVRDLIEFSKNHDEFILVITPEGTRKVVDKLKSGFYRIAEALDIPIALGFIDGDRRETGILKMFTPSGDYDADLKEIQAVYVGMHGIKEKQPRAD